MHRLWPIAVLLLLAGCGRDAPPQSPDSQGDRAHGRLAGPPEPIAVAPFERPDPDLVLLVTGSNRGMLEVCNCDGPMSGGLSRRSGLVLSYRKAFGDKVFVVSTGDAIAPEPNDARNPYVLKAYRTIGYDAVAMGEYELALPEALLGSEDRPPFVLSNPPTIGWQAETAARSILLPDAEAAKAELYAFITPEAFLFGDLPQEQVDAMRQISWPDDKRTSARPRIAVLHGPEEEMRPAVAALKPGLALWGHVEHTSKTLLDVDGVPVVRVGGHEHVAAVAIWFDPAGQVEHVELRVELVDTHWPLDMRVMNIYQAYAHAAMRQAMDADRKSGLAYVPSSVCGSCHPGQYEAWKASPHARAYQTLVDVGRQGDPNCLMCHTAGFGLMGGFHSIETTRDLGGVHCQNCHRFTIGEHEKADWKHADVTSDVCTSCHTPVTDPRFDDKKFRRVVLERCRGKGPALRLEDLQRRP